MTRGPSWFSKRNPFGLEIRTLHGLRYLDRVAVRLIEPLGKTGVYAFGMVICDRCGAMVGDTRRHAAWHRRVGVSK